MNPVVSHPIMSSVASRILLIRGQKVMVDSDLAELYGVSTKALNQAVKRNPGRFPADFMFQLSQDEKSEVVTKCDHLSRLKYSSALPYVFTEHGALMLGNVLKSERAVEMSLMVVRAFVQLREALLDYDEIAARLEAMEHKVGSHDQAISGLMEAVRQLMTPPEQKKRGIGFLADTEKEK